jgi:Fe-S oxidoreductase
MSLCLECKACKTECPSNVDMAKLKAEFLNAYYRRRHRPPGDLLAANVHRLFPWASKFAPIANGLTRGPIVRRMVEMVVGLDRRRSLPRFYRNNFRRWFQRDHSREQQAGLSRSVILLDDCFTTFTEPNIGRAAVRVLEAAGCRVELANICCGRALISKGCLPEARDLAMQALPVLAERVKDGTPILGVEPSCLLTLTDEWPDLVPGPEAQCVAAAAELADHWLAAQVKAGDLKLSLQPRSEKVLLHGHCHQKALRGAGGSVAALRLIPGLNVTQLETGCCGMAGSFGYDSANFDVSTQIANLDLLPALRLEPDATVAAPGTSCRHQIKDLANRRALHPLEVIAASLE